MPEEFSESGAPIWRHEGKEKREWTPPNMEGSSIEEIDAHIEKHIGKVDSVWHEILSDLVHIDVHTVAPSPDRPYYTLITSGMSDRPMTTPDGAHDCRYAELMLCLPGSWPMTKTSFDDPVHYWPIRWLKFLARFPHEYDTWLWHGHSIPNGDPAKPLAPNTRLSSLLLADPMTVSREFGRLPIASGKTIHFFAVLPLHDDELGFKLTQGSQALLEKIERAKVTELLDPARRSVLRPWWKVF